MAVVIYTQYIVPASVNTSIRPLGVSYRFYCDTFAELPTGALTVDEDTAYCVDTDLRYVRTGGAWVPNMVSAIAGTLVAAGPTPLVVGAVADGEFLKRVGTEVVGAAAPGGAAWGGITGTLSSQTDLQSALDAKQVSGSYASGTGSANGTNTGDQDLSGLAPKASPTFTGTVSGVTAAMVGLGSVNNTTDAGKPVSTAQQTALDLKANLTSPTLVTPVIGVATGTSLAATGLLTSSGTAGVGYATGAGGTVTQATNKATGVTLNKLTGAITMNAAALAAAAEVSFIVTNSTIAATDAVIVNHASAGTAGVYAVFAHTIGAGTFRIMVGNMSAGSLSEAIVIRFTIVKGVSA